MAWTSPRTWSACEIVTAAIMNTHVRDNLNQTFPALVTTLGDSVWATGANAGQRVAVGATGTFLAANSACLAGVAWDAIFQVGGFGGSQLSIGTAAYSPCATVHVRGASAGQTTTCPITTASMHGAVLIEDAGGGTNSGGMALFGAGGKTFAGIRGLVQNLTTCGVGHLSVIMRSDVTAACLTEVARFINTGTGTGQLHLVGTNFTACNTRMGNGITIGETSGDGNEKISLEDGNVTHGMTTWTNTGTYAHLSEFTSPGGGLLIRGLSGSQIAQQTTFRQDAFCGAALDTTKSAAAVGGILLFVGVKSGTTYTTAAASGNLLAISNAGSARFIFEGDGAAYEHVGTGLVNFDEHDDLALLNIAAAHASRNPIREHFLAWAGANRQILQDLDLIVFNDEGGHFVNRSRMQELLIGAVRQMGDRNKKLEARITQLEQLLLGPPKAGTT